MAGASIDARGQQEVDVQSTNQLWGALLPSVVLGLLYLAVFLHFRRMSWAKDVFDPKRRRLVMLEQGRGHPTLRGLPDAWRERSPSLTPTPLPPPDVPANPLTWFLSLWRVSDAAIITYTGADAYMFLRFLRIGCVRVAGPHDADDTTRRRIEFVTHINAFCTHTATGWPSPAPWSA